MRNQQAQFLLSRRSQVDVETGLERGARMLGMGCSGRALHTMQRSLKTMEAMKILSREVKCGQRFEIMETG